MMVHARRAADLLANWSGAGRSAVWSRQAGLGSKPTLSIKIAASPSRRPLRGIGQQMSRTRARTIMERKWCVLPWQTGVSPRLGRVAKLISAAVSSLSQNRCFFVRWGQPERGAERMASVGLLH